MVSGERDASSGERYQLLKMRAHAAAEAGWAAAMVAMALVVAELSLERRAATRRRARESGSLESRALVAAR